MQDPSIRKLSRAGIVRDPRYEKLSSNELRLAARLAGMFRDSIKVHMSHSYYYDHGYRSGLLHESNLWQIAAGIDDARPFSILESIDIPDFHIGILVDCSGSMNSDLRNRYTSPPPHKSGNSLASDFWKGLEDITIMSASRCLALGMAQALEDSSGVHLSVCGHTEEGGVVRLIMVKRPKTELVVDSFGHLSAQSGNLDGLALYAYAREMHKEMAAEENGLIVLISDGAPCHSPTIMHKAFAKCKNEFNLTVFPIGVGHELASDESPCREHYGAGNYVIAEDVVSSAPRIITRLNTVIEELKPM